MGSADDAAYGNGVIEQAAESVGVHPEWVPSAPGSYMTLDEQLCFGLYTASRAMTACYRPGLDALGLTYPQYLVMLVLWQHESVSVSELSERLQLSTGTLSPLLKRLESAGWLTRRRRTDDERLVQLDITERGRGKREAVIEATREALRPVIGMSLDEINELRAQLTALAARLRPAAPE
jgi:DNA-binding MarR family transcriptional regulator